MIGDPWSACCVCGVCRPFCGVCLPPIDDSDRRPSRADCLPSEGKPGDFDLSTADVGSWGVIACCRVLGFLDGVVLSLGVGGNSFKPMFTGLSGILKDGTTQYPRYYLK